MKTTRVRVTIEATVALPVESGAMTTGEVRVDLRDIALRVAADECYTAKFARVGAFGREWELLTDLPTSCILPAEGDTPTATWTGRPPGLEDRPHLWAVWSRDSGRLLGLEAEYRDGRVCWLPLGGEDGGPGKPARSLADAVAPYFRQELR